MLDLRAADTALRVLDEANNATVSEQWLGYHVLKGHFHPATADVQHHSVDWFDTLAPDGDLELVQRDFDAQIPPTLIVIFRHVMVLEQQRRLPTLGDHIHQRKLGNLT